MHKFVQQLHDYNRLYLASKNLPADSPELFSEVDLFTQLLSNFERNLGITFFKEADKAIVLNRVKEIYNSYDRAETLAVNQRELTQAVSRYISNEKTFFTEVFASAFQHYFDQYRAHNTKKTLAMASFIFALFFTAAIITLTVLMLPTHLAIFGFALAALGVLTEGLSLIAICYQSNKQNKAEEQFLPFAGLAGANRLSLFGKTLEQVQFDALLIENPKAFHG